MASSPPSSLIGLVTIHREHSLKFLILIRRARAGLAGEAIPRPAPEQWHQVRGKVAVFRRAYALQHSRSHLPAVGDNVINAASQPPSTKARDHLNVLLYGGQHEHVADLGELNSATPLSIAGPNCGGSLLTVTTLNWRDTSAVIRLRLGRVAFAHKPFYRERRHGRTRDETADEAAFVHRVKKYSRPGCCPLCDADGSRDTDDAPWHLFFDCKHPAIVRLRMRLFSSMPRMLRQLLARLHEAHASSKRPLSQMQRELQSNQLTDLLEGINWDTVDGRHVIFHVLTALPWPAAAAAQAEPATPLSHWLGSQFDAAIFQRRYRRRIANHIIRWAARWIRTFATARADLRGDARD